MSERSKPEAAPAPSDLPASPAGEMPVAEASRRLTSASPAAGLNDRWLVAGICIFLAAIVWVAFGQTWHHEFVNFDDDTYVYENPEVVRGLTLPGIVWAFTHIHAFNWHPLTWISHMLDCSLYGLNAGGHHLTNVLLHATTAILLFLVLRQMMGCLWRSAFVAAVFAIHPLRVESVAWVAERKDVLSGLFFMLTLWAYVRYAQNKASLNPVKGRGPHGALRPQPLGTAKRSEDGSTLNYALALLSFALGLMCKPMLVTLPLVLLLLDFWPLGRVTGDRWQVTRLRIPVPQLSTLNHLLLEKLPFFGLAIASCVVTIFAQAVGIQSFEKLSLPLRLGNASISYAAYLGQMFWPSDLAVLYPLTAGNVGVSEVVLSLILLAGISGGVFVLRRRCPCLLTGWLWYLIMLVPVIGIVQVGAQARADRYTYLPQIGLYLMLTWGVAELCAGWRHRRWLLGGLATVILAALIFCAHTQTSYWRNSESLWTHTLACTSDNFVAHNDLGNVLLKMGSVDEATAQYQKALQINPDCAEACYNLGNTVLQKGRVDEAIAYCQRALEINPNSPEAHGNLGNALLQKGQVDEAITEYQTVLQITPDSAKAYNNLGSALFQKGQVDEAIAYYQKTLQIEPGFAQAQNNLDYALRLKARVEEALARYQKTLQIEPDSVEALNNLAWLLATCPDSDIRDGVQAVKHAERACELTHDKVTLIVGTLAAAYAEAGRFDDAIAAAQKACALATAAGEPDLLAKNRELLALYRAHQPYREAAVK